MYIFDTMVNGVIIMTADQQIRYINKSAEKMFGFSKQELIGKNVTCLMPDPWYSRHDDYVESYLKTGIKKIIGIGRMVQVKIIYLL